MTTRWSNIFFRALSRWNLNWRKNRGVALGDTLLAFCGIFSWWCRKSFDKKRDCCKKDIRLHHRWWILHWRQCHWSLSDTMNRSVPWKKAGFWCKSGRPHSLRAKPSFGLKMKGQRNPVSDMVPRHWNLIAQSPEDWKGLFGAIKLLDLLGISKRHALKVKFTSKFIFTELQYYDRRRG